jgi:rhamnose transport system permease protein
MIFNRYKREISALIAYLVLLLAVGILAPSFFGGGNLRDLLINNAPILLIAIGMTLVILVGEIDISVGSQFAVASIVAGYLAKTGMPLPVLFVCLLLIGAAMGAGGEGAAGVCGEDVVPLPPVAVPAVRRLLELHVAVGVEDAPNWRTAR